MARRRAAVLDALTLHAHGHALKGLAMELGNGSLGHVGLGKFDEGHGAERARVAVGVATADVDVDWTLDQVDLEDLASL